VRKNVTLNEEVSFRRSRGSHMDIDSERHEEMVPSPPHAPTIQRETSPIDQIDHFDIVSPRNVSRDIAVGRKILAWDRQTL
jgi:hypothetical protein